MLKFVRAICVLLLLSVLARQVFVQNAKTSKALLVETGEGFHGDEVKARSGEKWLGLYVTRNGSFLTQSTLTVRRVVDPIADEDPMKPTGKSVSVNRREPPVFLVRNAEMLKPGPVKTVYRGGHTEKHELKHGTQIGLKLNEQNYWLKVTSKYPRSKDCHDCLPSDARLILKTADSIQIIYDLGKILRAEFKDETERMEEVADTTGWHLLWAGDADGDSKLDLYVGVSWHYNISERKLFLSSQANPGQLVKEVAKFVTSGC